MIKLVSSRFIEVARSYMHWVDAASSGSGSAPSLYQLHRGLSQLQAAALDLPPVMDDDLDDAADVLKERLEHDPQVQRSLAACLPFSAYSLVFDPLDEKERVAILTTLDDDLADIYWDISDGIALADAGYHGDAIWHLRFSYFTHWGRHAVHAQTAIWQYLADHQDED
jgi:hypothetical protein